MSKREYAYIPALLPEAREMACVSCLPHFVFSDANFLRFQNKKWALQISNLQHPFLTRFFLEGNAQGNQDAAEDCT